MQKKLVSPCLPELDSLSLKEAGKCLCRLGAKGIMDCVNWREYPEKPEITFSVAHTKKALFLAFRIRGNFVLGRFEEDQAPVYRDSCVEFFCRKPESALYTNLEFNCIGTCLGARQKARDKGRIPLTAEERHSIERHASLGRKAFGEKTGACPWELATRIPLALLDMEEKDLDSGLMANFYACCDDAPTRHYLSWNPVRTERPDFHRPEFFGNLVFARASAP